MNKKILFVGGLDSEKVTESLLRAAFIPFGELVSIQIPMDYKSGKSRGFGFVEYEDEEDAEHAIYNMDGAELFDHTIFVKTATKLKGFDSNKAAWEDENFNVGQGEAGEAGEEDGDHMEAS